MEASFESVVSKHRARRAEVAPARIFAWVTLAAALGTIGAAVYLDPGVLPVLDWSLAPWAVMVAGATLATISFGEGKPALSMDLPVLLACSFCIGPVAAGVVALVAAWDREELRGRIPLSRGAFNHAQTSLSVMAAGFAFEGLGGNVMDWPAVVPIAFAALLVDSVINVLAVALITAMGEGARLTEVIRSAIKGRPEGFALMYLAFGFVGILVSVAFTSIGSLGLVACAIPVLLAREAFRLRWQIHTLDLEIGSHREALRRVDERIAEERQDERMRIAEALHHDVLQSLHAVSLGGHVIQQDYRTGRLFDLENDVPELVTSVKKAMAELRDVIGGLQTAPTGSVGLVGTLELYVSHLHSRHGLNFVRDFDVDLGLEPALELVIYRVAQEALLNAARHSGADTVWIQLRRERDVISLSVVDNGIGIASFDRERKKNFGLVLMRERTRSVGGEIEIRSKRTTGTCIEARFPARIGRRG